MDTSEEQPVTFIFYERKSAKIDKLVPLGPGQTAANLGCLTKTEQRPEFESRSHYTCGESENSNFISSVKW